MGNTIDDTQYKTSKGTESFKNQVMVDEKWDFRAKLMNDMCDLEEKPTIFSILNVSITQIQKVKKRWTLFCFEYFSKPFVYLGDHTSKFKVGDVVDVDYYFSLTTNNVKFLCVFDMKHSKRNKDKCV
jgi:hypothetical protein